MRKLLYILVIMLATPALMVFLAQPALGQSASATLVGKVLTEQGEPVADAVVQARQDSTGTHRTTLTDPRGRYSFEGLAPSMWTVVARLGDGDLSDTRKVALRLQQTTTLDFSLGKGLAERITVRAQSPLVDRRETAGKLTVSGERSESLPVDGRNLTDLALLSSNVQRAAPGLLAGERGAVFTVNGQSARSNSFLVDGLDNNDTTSGTTTNSFFSQQVIQEFVLLTHQFAPEFGGASGGLLNVVTRQGTNEQFAEVFLQGSSDRWNETGSFMESLPDSGVSQRATRRFQVGTSLGGAFRKDRAFYFAAYEHQEADGLTPFTGVDRDGVGGGRLVAPSDDDSLFLRTDFNLGQSNTLMVRLSANDRSAEGINVGGVYTPESGFRIDEQDLQLAASLTTVISPSLLSESRFLASVSKFEQEANSSRPGVVRPSGIFGGNVLNRQNRDEEKFQLVQNLTWRSGAHTAKFGISAAHSNTDLSVRFNPRGSFTYDSDLPFDPGPTGDLPISATSSNDNCEVFAPGSLEPGNICSYPLYYSIISGEPDTVLEDTRIGLFAQDKVEVGKRWLLEYGLRYDISTYRIPPSATVDSPIPNGGSSRDTDNLAPRFGFTFVPKVDGRWVIRGGGGVFYDKLVLAFPATAAITSGTSIGIIPLQALAFEFTEADVEAGGSIPVVSPDPFTLRFSTGTELETPYTVMWNLGMETSFGPRHALRVDVVHSEGYHLPLLKDLNPTTGLVSGSAGLEILTGVRSECPVDQINPDLEIGAPCHARDPAHGSIAAIVTEGRSDYSGLDLNYRWQGDLSWFQSSYTLSRSEDQGFDPLKGGISLPPNSDDIAGERGRSDGDRLHRLVLSGDFGLGFWGVRSSTVAQLSSGLPYNVTTGQDDNFDGILTDRPEGVGRNDGEDSSVAAINAVRDQDAVDLQPIASLPEEPSFFQVDMRLYKRFLMGNGGNTEVFLQVFNLLDRENIGLLEGRAISPEFGKPVSLAGPPRTLELGLRVRY